MSKKTLLSIAVTALIFIVILANINLAELGRLFLTINPLYFAVSMLLFIPIIYLSALRWKIIISSDCTIGIVKSVKLTLMGIAFSSVTPSKLGDLTKAHYLKKEGLINLKRGIAAVVLEKLTDLFSISLILIIGMLLIGSFTALTMLFTTLALIFILISLAFTVLFRKLRFLRRFIGFLLRRKRTGSMIRDSYSFLEELRKSKRKLASIFSASLAQWLFSFIQIYFFFLCFNYFPPIELIMGLAPIAILIGMIPVTIAGMGTRESAFIALFLEYAPIIPITLVLGVGLLASMRYWILAVAGLPAAREYIKKL